MVKYKFHIQTNNLVHGLKLFNNISDIGSYCAMFTMCHTNVTNNTDYFENGIKMNK